MDWHCPVGKLILPEDDALACARAEIPPVRQPDRHTLFGLLQLRYRAAADEFRSGFHGVRQRVAKIASVKSANMQVVWDPPWDISRVSEDGKKGSA